ncbi:MAG: hypothetical protein PHH70_05385, partial [Candidatus Gracilibacteria bacterium]|nr:hypothetical protein [Candidatus Gracilibacteria bacterium]
MNFLSDTRKKGVESMKRGFDSVAKTMCSSSRRVSDILRLTPQNNSFNEGQHGGFSENNASFEPLFADNPRNVIGFKPGVASAVVAGVIASTAAVYGAEFDK